MKTKDLKKKLKAKTKSKSLTRKDFVSTGSTLLNLACTGNPFRGYAKGSYYFIVGDSVSGKTFLSLTCLAEASINKNFKDYRFIYDNNEGGAMMDIEKFFGKGVYERMESPALDYDDDMICDTQFVYSTTIEEFYYHVDDALQERKPFIYILDSMDSLSSKDEADKFEEQKKAHRKGVQTAGSYGDGKAKKNSANLRRLLTPLRKTGSILIIINQTRDNIGFGFERKTRSGGHALRFYACTEYWSSVKSQIKKTVQGKPRQLGVKCLIQFKKNRFQGKLRKIELPIYHSFGIDDLGSCIDYLIEEGHWTLKGNSVLAEEFDVKATKEKLIKQIEENNWERQLRSIVGDVWNEIEDACSVKRKRRYE